MNVFKSFLFLPFKILWGEYMARIIEAQNGGRRIIKMSVDDVITIVKDYQRIVPRFSQEKDARSFLADTVIYIPEDL